MKRWEEGSEERKADSMERVRELVQG